MFTHLRSLHAIAAERGDGLRPELLRPMSEARADQEYSGCVKVLEPEDIEILIDSLPPVAFR